MRILMKTLLAGPGGVCQPGEIHDVGGKEAQALIAGGYAEQVIDQASAEHRGGRTRKDKAPDRTQFDAAAQLAAEIAELEARLATAAETDKPAVEDALATKRAAFAALAE